MKPRGQGSGDLDGFLDAGSRLQGELRFDDTFRVDGRVNGQVISQGELVVGVGGEVDGEVRVARVCVAGTLRGTVHAQRLEIAAGGRVLATVEARTLVLEDGGFLQGECRIVRPGKTVEPIPAAQPVPLAVAHRR